MGESEILDKLYKELRLDLWWQELVGQKNPSFDTFDRDVAIANLPRTEVKAAEAVHEKFKNVLSYTEERNQWYLWDGRIHTPCGGDGIAIKIAKLYYKAMNDALDFIKEFLDKEASKIESSNATNAKDEAKKMREWYDKGEIIKHKSFRDKVSTDAGLNALVRTMKTECDVPSDYYDNDQRWFVMKNKVIDLDEFRAGNWVCVPHDPSRAVTKFFDAEFKEKRSDMVNYGHWDSFLLNSIPDEAARKYLQKVVGAAFMGTSKLRAILNLHGPPGSGKSVFINTFFKLGNGGAGYVCMPDSNVIVKVTGQNFEQDTLKGCRFYGISEPPMNAPIDNEFFKKLTGDEWVMTRTLNVKSSGWVPQGVPFVASNKPLKINTRDKAIVERVQMIEFPVEFVKDHPDPARRKVANLEQLIMDDRERVLEWIIQGMFLFRNDDQQLSAPDSVVALQNDVVTEASTALRWVSDFIEDGLIKIDFNQPEEYFLSIKDAYQRYQQWVAMNGEKHPLPLRYFSQDIENRYNGSVRVAGSSRFKGIIVTPEYRKLVSAGSINGTYGGF
jgi:phage/plasmid-associated DNA primase